jgi:hypothetical protein
MSVHTCHLSLRRLRSLCVACGRFCVEGPSLAVAFLTTGGRLQSLSGKEREGFSQCREQCRPPYVRSLLGLATIVNPSRWAPAIRHIMKSMYVIQQGFDICTYISHEYETEPMILGHSKIVRCSVSSLSDFFLLKLQLTLILGKYTAHAYRTWRRGQCNSIGGRRKVK